MKDNNRIDNTIDNTVGNINNVVENIEEKIKKYKNLKKSPIRVFERREYKEFTLYVLQNKIGIFKTPVETKENFLEDEKKEKFQVIEKFNEWTVVKLI